jgi:nucleotidyltransferase/DNA polymerase involved in DNA repair
VSGSSVPRALLWADVDRMFYSVEVLERPELGLAGTDRPVVIGWDPRESPRSIVTTANDAARALGITSGMSTAIARRRAPDTMLFLPPRHELYSTYSRRLMDLLGTETPTLEQCSIDEAVMDWTAHGFDQASVVWLRQRVLDELGLSVSFGLASNRLVAKIGSEVAKGEPSHTCLVRPGTEAAFLAQRPIRALIGVGPKNERRLFGLGLVTIGDLAALPVESLVDEFGSAYGRYLFEASHGAGSSQLNTAREYRSISEETTFDADTANRSVIWRRLQRQAEEVALKLKREGLVAAEVAVKVRYGNWETITRQQRLGTPTDEAGVLAAGAAALMKRHWQQTRPIRLIGLRVARLQTASPSQQLPLL